MIGFGDGRAPDGGRVALETGVDDVGLMDETQRTGQLGTVAQELRPCDHDVTPGGHRAACHRCLVLDEACFANVGGIGVNSSAITPLVALEQRAANGQKAIGFDGASVVHAPAGLRLIVDEG